MSFTESEVRKVNVTFSQNRAKVSPELARFLEYTNSNILAKFKSELELGSQGAETLFADMLIWLFLCANSKIPLAPPPSVDRAWHIFILFTRDYADFCAHYCEHFIHHVPTVASAENDGQAWRNTIAMVERTFGSLSAMSENWRMSVKTPKGCTGQDGKCSNRT